MIDKIENLLFVLVIVIGLGWYGIDGLIGNQEEVQSFSINDIESEKISSRFVRITDCFLQEEYLVHYEENTNKVMELIVPVVGVNFWQDDVIGEVKVLIKRDKTKFSDDCTQEDNCFDDLLKEEETGGFIVEGRVLKGLDDLSGEDRELIESASFQLAEDFILIEENDIKKRSVTLSILSIIGAILIGTGYAWMKFSKQNKE